MCVLKIKSFWLSCSKFVSDVIDFTDTRKHELHVTIVKFFS